MPTSNTEESRKTSVRILSEAGIAKLRSMTENSTVYAEFLRFQGRVYKHTVNVALEFFVQKPETQFIATQQQWNNANCTISQGSEAIRFVDKNGNHVDYYDFSQVEETTPPSIWTINVHNVQIVKTGLGIPSNSPLINGVIYRTMNAVRITECMKSLNVAPNEYNSFKNAWRFVLVPQIAKSIYQFPENSNRTVADIYDRFREFDNQGIKNNQHGITWLEWENKGKYYIKSGCQK